MGAYQNTDWQAAIESTIAWWAEAGVDTLVAAEPRNWLAVPAGAAPRTKAAEPAVAQVLLPDTLATLLEWRLGDGAPEARMPGTSLPAAGPAEAETMILVDCPERDDRGALLEGSAGALLDRMLAAIGLHRGAVHLAALCGRRPPAGRIDDPLARELAAVALHHAGLVAPKRLLVMGNAASRAILGIELLEARGSLRELNHKGGNTSAVVATFHPRFLMERPAMKAEAWKDLQMLMGGTR